MARRFGSAMISNTDSTLLIYFTEHMLVKVYKSRGPRNGFSRRAGMHRPRLSWRVRFRVLRDPAASALRREDCPHHPGRRTHHLRTPKCVRLGGHLKTGHRGSLQNRPTSRGPGPEVVVPRRWSPRQEFSDLSVAEPRHADYYWIHLGGRIVATQVRPERRPRRGKGGRRPAAPEASHSGPKAINSRGLGTESPT
jgi:hypothetical protein